jgi:hypothetical protein
MLFALDLKLQLVEINYFWLRSRLHSYLHLTVGLPSDGEVNMIWKENIEVRVGSFPVHVAW